MKSLLMLTVCFVTIALCSSDEDDINVKKQEILDKLLDPEVYDKRVRPKGSGPTNVSISMYILDVIDMDHFLKEFTLQCYFRQKWKDQRLDFSQKWKDEGLDSSDKTRRKIRAAEDNKIWKPDLFFVNDIKGEIHDIMVPNHFLRIEEGGEILFSSRVSVILTCHTDLKFYPHDQQKCSVQIESYGYPAADLAVQWAGDNAVGINEKMSDSKYVLLDHEEKSYTVSVNETTYTRLELELHFSRNSHPFLISVYLPHILLVILSWATFCIDHKNVTIRLIYLGLILFLTLRLIPHSKGHDLHITALDVWIAVCVMFIVAAFLESIFVNQAANQEDAESAKERDAELQAINSGHMNVEKTRLYLNVIQKSEPGASCHLLDMGLNSRMQMLAFLTLLLWVSGFLESMAPNKGRESYLILKMDKKNEETKGNKIFGRFAGKYSTRSKQLDVMCRVVSPILFLLFNIIYWSVCCSASKYH